MNRLKVARSAVTMSVLLWTCLGTSALVAKGDSDAKSQLGFGVDMAKRGLWSEALFRFEQAHRLSPGNVSILNNLAICYEAGGRFEEALATYREALNLAPENKVVKQNYSRFAEFYQGFRPRKTGAPATGPAPVAPTEAPAGEAPPTDAPPASSPPPEAAPPPVPSVSPPSPTLSSQVTQASANDFGGGH
jgi:tetratricopeptide (TPR) repeat protein